VRVVQQPAAALAARRDGEGIAELDVDYAYSEALAVNASEHAHAHGGAGGAAHDGGGARGLLQHPHEVGRRVEKIGYVKVRVARQRLLRPKQRAARAARRACVRSRSWF
jgi:hypothetical protein